MRTRHITFGDFWDYSHFLDFKQIPGPVAVLVVAAAKVHSLNTFCTINHHFQESPCRIIIFNEVGTGRFFGNFPVFDIVIFLAGQSHPLVHLLLNSSSDTSNFVFPKLRLPPREKK